MRIESSGEPDTAERIFCEAVSRPRGERRAYVDDVCARLAEEGVARDGRASLRAAVEAMLDADETADGFLEVSPEHSAIALAGDDLSGQTFGAWRLTRRLGAGGMGEVYQAVPNDDPSSATVAIKILRADTAVGRERFRREISLLQRLDHPNVARYLEGGEAGGRPFAVLELVDGVPLDAFCRDGERSADEILMLLVALCRAVAYAHSVGVIHRDIKPSNVLVRRSGDPVLLDFGIARLAEAAQQERSATPEFATASGPGPFSAGFASPEQLRGDPIVPATDQYALGLLIERLTRPLVGRVRDAAVRIAALTRADSPRDRLDSVDQLARCLELLRCGRTGTAARVLWSVRARRMARRHRIGIALALAGLGLAAFGGLALRSEADAQRDLSTVRVELARARWQASAGAAVHELSLQAPTRGGEAPSLVDRLLAAADALEREFVDDLRCLAALRVEVSRSLESAGAFDDASIRLQDALRWQQSELGATAPDSVETLRRLVGVLQRGGRFEAALPHLRTLVEVLRETAPGRPELRSAEASLASLERTLRRR